MSGILLFGATGQVGTAIRNAVAGTVISAPTSRDVSLADQSALTAYIEQMRPDAVINAAAYTNVDSAETDATAAYAINAEAPRAMAAVCARLGIRFVHFSTDYVFDGGGALPYQASAATNPLNVYGASKREGEVRVLTTYSQAAVVRTAWVHSGGGVNFVGTAVRLLARGTSMRVVDDQVGSPTSAKTLATAALKLLERPGVTGLQHVTDSGVASWYDMACEILRELQAGGVATSATVVPVSSAEFPRPALRPKVSLLDCHASRQLLDFVPPHWAVGVRESTRAWLATL